MNRMNASSTKVYKAGSLINVTSPKDIDTLFYLVCSQLTINSTQPPSRCSNSSSVTSPSISKDVFFTTLEVSKLSKVLLAIVFCVILVAALFGNILVLSTVLANKIMWTAMHIFIVSLAVSDVLVSVTCIPLNIGQALTTEWTFSSLSCQLMPFFMQMSITASALTLCCMAAERYMAIVHPLKLNILQSTVRVLLLLAAVWTVAFAAAAPYAFYYHTRSICGRVLPNGKCDEDTRHTLCSAREGSALPLSSIHWLTFLILFVLPAVVLGLAYGVIIYKLWVKAPVGVVTISAVGMRTRYKKKAIKMLIMVVVLFLTCWAPLLTFDLITMTNHDIRASSSLMNLRYFLQCLALSSTAYNPIIYAFMNQKFRTNFQTLLLRHRARVAPLILETQQGSPVNGFKTGSSNIGALKRSNSPMHTKSTRM